MKSAVICRMQAPLLQKMLDKSELYDYNTTIYIKKEENENVQV